MASMLKPARVGRELLGKLRAARVESDGAKIVDLLTIAPELQGAACEIVRGDDDDGADQRELWAQGFFISPEPQPTVELEPREVVPIGAEAEPKALR
jgi:hypothetical protein